MTRVTNGGVMLTPKKRRKGVHAKTKTSNHKTSKNYVKKYRGQGK